MITIDRAIKIIENVDAENTVSIARHGNLEDVLEVLEFLRDVYDYNIEKKIICKTEIDDITGESREITVCPTCDNYLPAIYDYCPSCGQALDWSDYLAEVTE